jgi:hypothetical protein
MRLALDLVRRARDFAEAAVLPERRRAMVLVGLNASAAALALGALHVGGTLVRGAPDLPAPPPLTSETVAKAAAKTIRPAMKVAPVSFEAVPDEAILFAPPVATPTTFTSGGGNTDATFATPPAQTEPSPSSPSPVKPVSSSPLAHPIKIALGRTVKSIKPIAHGAPLILSELIAGDDGGQGTASGALSADAGLSSASGLSVAAGGSLSAATSATVGSATGVASSAVASVSSAVASTVSTVGHTMSSAVGGLR